METYLGECNLNTYFIYMYLDDIIVFFIWRTYSKTTKHKANKSFFQNKVKYLEHMLSKQWNLTRSGKDWEIRDFTLFNQPRWSQADLLDTTFYQTLYEGCKTFKSADPTLNK